MNTKKTLAFVLVLVCMVYFCLRMGNLSKVHPYRPTGGVAQQKINMNNNLQIVYTVSQDFLGLVASIRNDLFC